MDRANVDRNIFEAIWIERIHLLFFFAPPAPVAACMPWDRLRVEPNVIHNWKKKREDSKTGHEPRSTSMMWCHPKGHQNDFFKIHTAVVAVGVLKDVAALRSTVRTDWTRAVAADAPKSWKSFAKMLGLHSCPAVGLCRRQSTCQTVVVCSDGCQWNARQWAVLRSQLLRWAVYRGACQAADVHSAALVCCCTCTFDWSSSRRRTTDVRVDPSNWCRPDAIRQNCKSIQQIAFVWDRQQKPQR